MSAPRTSPAALKMLWSMFRQLVRAANWNADEAMDERAALTARILGRPASWSALRPGDIDALKDALKAAVGRLPLESTAAGAESTADAAQRRRLVFGIEHDFTAAYGSQLDGETAIASVLSDIYGVTHAYACGKWRSMPLPELSKLRKTAARCLRGQTRRQNSKTGGVSAQNRVKIPS